MNVTGLLDPELAPAVEALGQLDLAASDTADRQWPVPAVELSDRVVRADLVVPGDPEVAIRLHRPVGIDGPLPCIVSMHAGAYVAGDATLDDAMFDDWCPRLGVMGVSVNYRLAPHTPYPGPLMDCYAALTYVHDHGPELGIDPSLIGLHGVNAGGGLAAALAVVARDHGDIPVAFQLLDSPMLDDRQKTASSLLDSPTWTAASTEHGWRSYLGDLYGTADLPIYAAAARCTKLRRLPPAFISVGSLDGFLDEAVDYASRLNHDGVVTELHVYPGAPHGYQLARGSDVARRAERDKVDWLRRQISRP